MLDALSFLSFSPSFLLFFSAKSLNLRSMLSLSMGEVEPVGFE